MCWKKHLWHEREQNTGRIHEIQKFTPLDHEQLTWLVYLYSEKRQKYKVSRLFTYLFIYLLIYLFTDLFT